MITHRLPTALGSETFTAAGAPWVPQEWLFSLSVAAATNHHLFSVLSLALSAMPLGILAMVYLRARDKATPEAIGVALLLCGVALLESFGTRAQVLGWGALAAFTFFLERRDRWYYAAIPTAILWANLHASVAIAPAIVLARIAATLGDRGLRSTRELLMLPAVALAMFCTPLGWRLPMFAVTLAANPIRHFIMEWQPPGLHDFSFIFGALPLALAIALGGSTTLTADKTRSFPVAVLFLAMLFAFRNTALFAIVTAPVAATGFDVIFPRLRDIGKRARELEGAALATVGVAVIASALALAQMQSQEPPRLPIGAIAFLAADDVHHRVFCENFTWCSVALQYPKLRTFIDGRCDAYPLAVWRQYLSAIDVDPGWERPLSAHRVDAVVAQRGSRFAGALTTNAAWRRAFQDNGYVVFRRD